MSTVQEEREHNNGDHKIPLTVSLAVSILIGALSAGATWGVTQRTLSETVTKLEEERNANRVLQTELAQHTTEIAVIKVQYSEILRRLQSIDETLQAKR